MIRFTLEILDDLSAAILSDLEEVLSKEGLDLQETV